MISVPGRKADADADRDERCHQNVYFCFLGYRFAELCGENSNEKNCQRTAGTAEGIRRKTDGNK